MKLDRRVEEKGSQSVWDELASNPDGVLIDVRTRPEWQYVGLPDISELGKELVLIEWRMYPTMVVNERFVLELRHRLGDSIPSNLYFICRSGVRSREAAEFVLNSMSAEKILTRCVNVSDGFEGDLDSCWHRGKKNGWKFSGLSWVQR